MDGPLWIFGYGSLMWRPGFEPAERRPALLRGLHRSFCVVSHVHRGTPKQPGLVAGLDRGGACRGVAFRIERSAEREVIDYLRAREQATMVYRETRLPVELAGGEEGGPRRVAALCFIVDRRHHQYAGPMSVADKAGLVRVGVGQSGTSLDYLADMLGCLTRMGIRDAGIERLAAAVGVAPDPTLAPGVAASSAVRPGEPRP